MATFLLVLILVVLWLFVAALRSLQIVQTKLSQYELERRAAAKNEDALLLKRREAALPDIRTLKYLLEILIMVIITVILVVRFGAWLGGLLTFLAMVLFEIVARSQFIAAKAQRLYDKYELDLVEMSEKIHPILRFLHADSSFTPGQFVYSKEELLARLQTTHGIFTKHELLLIDHGLQFGSALVKDVMTPRTMIDAAKAGDTLGPVTLNRLHNSGHSRFPVFSGDIDHVVGMLYLHDLVPLKKNIHKVEDAMHEEVFYVREDQDLEHALAAFLKTHHHLFVVVNEYRETVGLLSLEDVIESLLGRKIVDEFDKHHDLRTVAETNPRANNVPKKHKNV